MHLIYGITPKAWVCGTIGSTQMKVIACLMSPTLRVEGLHDNKEEKDQISKVGGGQEDSGTGDGIIRT